MIDRSNNAAVCFLLTSSFPWGRQDFMTQDIGFAECRFVFRVSVTVEVGWPFPLASPEQSWRTMVNIRGSAACW